MLIPLLLMIMALVAIVGLILATAQVAVAYYFIRRAWLWLLIPVLWPIYIVIGSVLLLLPFALSA